MTLIQIKNYEIMKIVSKICRIKVKIDKPQPKSELSQVKAWAKVVCVITSVPVLSLATEMFKTHINCVLMQCKPDRDTIIIVAINWKWCVVAKT